LNRRNYYDDNHSSLKPKAGEDLKHNFSEPIILFEDEQGSPCELELLLF
jgi:hypothetical protein